jgi:hypothetical protein
MINFETHDYVVCNEYSSFITLQYWMIKIVQLNIHIKGAKHIIELN